MFGYINPDRPYLFTALSSKDCFSSWRFIISTASGWRRFARLNPLLNQCLKTPLLYGRFNVRIYQSRQTVSFYQGRNFVQGAVLRTVQKHRRGLRTAGAFGFDLRYGIYVTNSFSACSTVLPANTE